MNLTDDFPVLRTLDPADREIDPNSPRARADLERILATDPALPALRPRRSRRLAVSVALGAAAAATVAALVLPSALGGDKAFASWTSSPSGMSASKRADAANSCRSHQKSGSHEYADQLKSAGTAISERRGAWTLVILAGRDGFSALCITDDSKHLFRSYFGAIGSTPPANRPSNRGLAPLVLGTGSIDGNELSVAAGAAGSDVTAVTYTSPTRGKVNATVSGGQFALWLPGNDLTGGAKGTSVQVTYRDGTTATVTLHL
ncbi:hypothetical protein [Kribbella monticola]|uniref:hypothetical protein n=1 Tax=Kribbella monticola TaxID=2185285 RepID=UPI000DD4640B|nr:hypothetical protein [Kribbella monticola]